VTAVNGGGIGGPNSNLPPIHTDAQIIGAWELFTISGPVGCATQQQILDVIANPFTTFCVNIQTLDGHFVTAQNGGGIGGANNVPVHTDAMQAGVWGGFQLISD
jgi:hypothetical protein